MNIGRVVFGPTSDPSSYGFDTPQILSVSITPTTASQVCGCIGPQAGETKCPCALRAESRQGQRMVRYGVVVDGVYYALVPKSKSSA